MTEYVNRQWAVDVGGTSFIEPTNGRQFKCVFEILHDFGGYTSYADIAFYNLDPNTVARLFKRGEPISFKAGYEGTIDTIFTGTIRNVLRERQGPSTITRLICRGGKIPSKQTQVNETLGKNATVVDVIRACANAIGYPIVMDDAQFSDTEPYPFGYTLNGDPRVYLDNLTEVHGFDYVIENDRMIIVRRGQVRTGSTHVVSQFTGMEGIPEITEVGADVVTRLNPKIKIGGLYRIESNLATFNFSNLYFVDIPESAGQGEYKIFRVSHSGDTWGDTWSTKITGFRQ